MKILRPFIILLVISFFLIGCSYSNTEIYFVDPEPGEPAIIFATSNLDSMVDPSVTDSLLIIYKLEIEHAELYYVEGGMENYRIYELTPDYDPDTLAGPFVVTDSFWLQGSLPVEPGSKSLFLSFYYSSNTNSLGDILGVEVDILDLEYTVTMEGGTE
ncbi:MAG: hypothetical protein V2B15_16300 [Bacteroidota bacterium]